MDTNVVGRLVRALAPPDATPEAVLIVETVVNGILARLTPAEIAQREAQFDRIARAVEMSGADWNIDDVVMLTEKLAAHPN